MAFKYVTFIHLNYRAITFSYNFKDQHDLTTTKMTSRSSGY